MRKIAAEAALAVLAVLLGFIALRPQRRAAFRESIAVHASRSLGRFKDLIKGVNDGPLSPSGWNRALNLNLSEHYAKLGLKVIRFHDLWVVDELDTIFPDPEADPGDPGSYNFAGLDRCVEEALKHADLLILRLGYDWNDPPKNKPHLSLEKLAEVAKHVVLHYTAGWADGYNYTGRIWVEVWNEPDIEQFWGLSDEEFFQLYEAVARAIAEANTGVKVGGPGIAFNLTFLEKFLGYVSSREVPLDFVSWHIYTTKPEDVAQRAKAVKRLMERYGYGDLPSVLTEWNYWLERDWDFFRSREVAAFQAATLILLEDAPVEVATLYRGDAWKWGGIFNERGEPEYPYYVWAAHRRVVENATRVEVAVRNGYLRAIAGLAGDGTLRVLVVNYRGEEVEYTVEAAGYRLAKVYTVERGLTEVEACSGDSCLIGPYAVQLLEFVKG